jgi:signal transduction histidine kinase
MRPVATHDPEELLTRLVHELRQPLGTIENGAYLTRLLLTPEQTRAREQLRNIEHQVDRAALLLSEAVAEMMRLRSHRAAGRVEVGRGY